MARKRANLSDLLNDLTFRTLYEKYRLISVNAFEWAGLPDGIMERHVENTLFDHGKAIFYRSDKMGFMCLRCDSTGQVNVYNDPLAYHAYGVGYQERVAAENCVIIENNKLRIPTNPFIMHYVNKLTEAERTMDVNIKACKTPVVFACDDKDVLSFKRLFQQVDGNIPAIYADKGLNLDAVQAFKTGVQFMGKELQDYANGEEGKLLTFLGVNNTPVDKKERLITDEAQANNELIQSFADLQLEARQRAAKEINAMYGLNVTVKRREVVVDKPAEEVDNDVPD